MVTTLLDGPPVARARRRALLGHTPALDGLRGTALVVIIVYHFYGATGPLPGGWAALDVFFALSGFLITSLLLDEVRVHGRIDLRAFWARRALRLLPALLVFLGCWVVLLLLFHDSGWLAAVPSGDGSGRDVDVSGALLDVGATLLYGLNWVHALGGGEAPIAHLWSLSVEEQFYVVWPLALLLLLRLRGRARLVPVVAVAAASAALPWFLYDGGAGTDRVYFGTDTRAIGMLAGVLAAMVWHRRRTAGVGSGRWGAQRAWAGMAAVVAVMALVGNGPFKSLLAPTVLGIAVAQLLPHLADSPDGAMARALRSRVQTWLGKRSYAVYLWHYPVATWTHPVDAWWRVPVGVAASLLLAELSWRLVEARALRHAVRFKPGRRAAGWPPAAEEVAAPTAARPSLPALAEGRRPAAA